MTTVLPLFVELLPQILVVFPDDFIDGRLVHVVSAITHFFSPLIFLAIDLYEIV